MSNPEIPQQAQQNHRQAASHPVACIECRQQKVRCLGRDGDNPCERCAKRSLECVVDFSYKRTAKRKAIGQLEAEIADLKQQLLEQQNLNQINQNQLNQLNQMTQMTQMNQNQLNQTNPSSPVNQGNQGSQGNQTGFSNIYPEPVPGLDASKRRKIVLPPASFSSSAKRPPLPPQPHIATYYSPSRTALDASLKPITLEPEVIAVLFKEYVSNYHRVLPVVEVQHGPEFVYNASPALFWTLMAIASRRKTEEIPPDIGFERLSSVQKRLLSEIAVSPIVVHGHSLEFNLPSVYAVQAFLLCTLWPPPTASINADMSWNASGIACLTAIRAGLHCPGHASDFERIFKSNKTHRANIREQLVTWVDTNALTQAIANMFGFPSAASFHLHTRYPYHNIDLPPRVRHMYELQRVAHEIELSLGRLTPELSLDQATASSLIRVHAGRYDEIEAQYASQMDAWTLFTLHAGRAQLFSYYLFGKAETEGVLALYYSCLTLLDHVVAQEDDYLKFLPVVSILILWQTSSVVARLWHSRWSIHLDKRSGEMLYQQTIAKVRLASVFEHDLPFRASEIMAQMWAAFSAMRRNNHHKAVSTTLTLKSRMSASVFFDSLYAMREQCEIDSHAPTQLTKRNKNGNDDVDAAPRNSGSEENPVSKWIGIQALLSPEGSGVVSPASTDPNSNFEVLAWQDVNTVMEDFGFGLGELPYVDDI